MRRASRAFALVLLPLVALVAVGCNSDDEAEAATPEPFVPVSRAVETEVGLLLVQRDVAPSLTRATGLDAETLEDLDGEVATDHPGALDRTGRWLAPFDPAAWPDQAVEVYDLASRDLAWSVDHLPYGHLEWHDSGLYLWGDGCAEPAQLGGGACDVDWTRGLWRLTSNGAEELVRFDFAPFLSTTMHSADGARAYVLAVETDLCCGIDPEGDAFLAVLDLEAGQVEARIELPGLLVGQPGHWLGSTDHLYGGYYWPGTALSPDGSEAYVVHAETDQVVVIDLEGLRVGATHSFEDSDSGVSRLGDWLLGQFALRAEAKASAQYIREIEITADGRYLLVGGSTVEEHPDDVPTDGFVESVGAGLAVIDLTTMAAVYRQDDAWSFELAPNGYSVLVWGRATPGLAVLDLRTFSVQELWPTQDVSLAFTAPNGRVGYVALGLSAVRTLVAFDLETGEVLAERRFSDGLWPAPLVTSR